MVYGSGGGRGATHGALLVVPDALSRRPDYVVKSPREGLAEAGVLNKETDLPEGVKMELNGMDSDEMCTSKSPAAVPAWLATVEIKLGRRGTDAADRRTGTRSH